MLPQACTTSPVDPFSLYGDSEYRRWRTEKLAYYPSSLAELMVEVRDPRALSVQERRAIAARMGKANMAFYHCDRKLDDGDLRTFCEQLGLRRVDRHLCVGDNGVAAITVKPRQAGSEYIPYTDRPINWHTDGYYNTTATRIQAMALHCVRPARSGGVNALLDHEMAYLLLRDADPRYIKALMQADAMTIPPNMEQGRELRPARIGPVFSVTATGHLHMRYTARTRSIQWKDDASVREAAAWLSELLRSDCPFIFRHRLEAGQGMVCHNVLHNRSGFRDGPQKRLLLRSRFYDRIAEVV